MGNVTAKTSGEIASFMTPAKTNIKSFKVHFSPKQLGTGDPSPENIREIVGWDGVEAYNDPEYGGFIVWNQLYNYGGSTGTNGGIKYTKLGNGVWEIKGTSDTTSGTAARRRQIQSPSWEANHVYWFSARAVGEGTQYLQMVLSNSGSIKATTTLYNGAFAKPTVSINQFSFRVLTQNITVDVIARPQIVDLTKLFGEEMANYIYNLEVSKSSAGKDYFFNLFPKDWYEYNAGELTTVSAVNNEPYTNLSYQWKKLPDEYQEVEYIESDGGQYIDTGILPSSTDVYSFKGEFPNKDNSVLFGCRSSGTYRDSNQLYLNRNVDKNIKSVMLVVNTASSNNTEYTKNIFFYNGDNLPLEIDEKNISINGRTSESFNPTQSIYLLGFNVLGTNSITVGGGKLVYFKIDGRCNFIPCYRKLDNEIGMYDTVSQTFYTNQGTGEFLKGEDVFCDTAYGGYIDLISGELVEEWNRIILDGTETWSNPDNGFLTEKYNNSPSYPDGVCSTYVVAKNYTQVNGTNKRIAITSTGVRLHDSQFVNITSLKTYLQSNNIYFCYKTNEPITHQLTPTQLQSFVGQNNFWSNADYVEVEYDLIETEDIQKCRKKIILNQPHIESVSSNIANFTTDMKAPLKECKVYFEPVQEGEGDPSPENICPISGWVGMQLQKTRTNILNPSANPIWDGSNVYTLNQDGSVTQSGSDGRGWISNTFTGLFLKKGQYTLSFTAPNITCNLRTSIDDYTENYRKTNSVLSFTLTEDCTVKWKASTSSYPVTYAVQLEVGTEATAYEPYNGTTLPISWQSEAGTVYGGKLDVLSGVMRVEWTSIDLATLSGWKNNMNGNNAVEIFCTLNGKKEGRTNIISNMLKTGMEMNARDAAVFSTRGFPTSSAIAVKVPKTVAQDPSEVVTWIANNHPMACYELVEPIEIQLTPQQLLTFKGANNIWSDADGQTKVKFWTH